MTFATTRAGMADIRERDEIERIKINILAQTQSMVDRGTVLYQALSDAGDKAEVLAIRTDFIAQMRTILGI